MQGIKTRSGTLVLADRLLGSEDFDRHLAVVFQVFGEINRVHPAAADFPLNRIAKSLFGIAGIHSTTAVSTNPARVPFFFSLIYYACGDVRTLCAEIPL